MASVSGSLRSRRMRLMTTLVTALLVGALGNEITLTAEPIWASGSSVRYALLRREVHLGSAVKNAEAFVTAAQSGPMEKLLGSYRLYVEGEAVAIGPGRGEVRTAAYPAGERGANFTMFDALDLTARITSAG